MGNKLGWVLAGVLLLAIVGIFLLMVVFPSHSKSKLDPEDLLLLSQQLKPEHLTERPMDGDGNAGEAYYAAIQLSREHAALIDGATRRLLSKSDARLTAEERKVLDQIATEVARGAERKKMDFVLKLEPTVLQVRQRPPPIVEGMEKLLAAQQLNAFDHVRAGTEADFAKAERVYHDALTMGYHFANERKLMATARKGYGFQIAACTKLRDLYAKCWTAKRDRIAKVVEYERDMKPVRDLYTKKRDLMASINTWTETPGSVFDIAENDQDPVWRVEGILALGKLKYATSERGDKRYVKKLIERFKKSDDPMEAAAAKAADELTLEQYRNLDSEWDY